jgi:5-formyltetrahydrofolate cyclo-ligase
MSDPGSSPLFSTAEVRQKKAALRKIIRADLKRFTPEKRDRDSESVSSRLRNTRIWKRARAILFYAALPGEIDLSGLAEVARREGRTVALPQFDKGLGVYRACAVAEPSTDLIAGKFGVAEPGPRCPAIGLDELDLILVPGLAFDKNGHRLGRGGGFYDRLLANTSAVKCGVGFDEQVHADIPVEDHDVLLDYIVTPGFWLEFGRERHGDELVG